MKSILACFVAISPLAAQTHAPAAPVANANTQLVQRLKSQPVARINGTVLTQGDLLREMYSIFPYARTHNGFPKAMEADIRAGALKMIEFEELVYQEGQRRKLAVPPAQLSRAFADFRRQFASDEEYRDYLASEMGGSEEKLRAGIRRSILIDRMMKTEVADRSAVTPAEEKEFYDKNPQRFSYPESVGFQSISVLPKAKATPADLKDAEKRANDALRQAKAARNYADFGLLAEKISEDDYRVNMGDHKVVELANLPPSMVKVMSGLQAGQVSDLIRVDQAWCVVRLVKHFPPGMKSFAEVKDELRKQMERDKSQRLRAALDKKLRATAKVEEL